MSQSFLRTARIRWLLAAVTAASLGLAFLCLVSAAGSSVATARSAPAAADPAAITVPADASTAHERSHGAYLYGIPGSDGTSLYVATGGLGQLTTDVYATVTSSTSHERSHTLAFSPATGEYDHIFEGLFMARTTDDGAIQITTTLATLGSSAYVRYYVPGVAPADLLSRDGQVSLYLNSDSLAPESYVVIMPTAALPGDPPPGHRLISPAYSLRASGAVTASLAPMILTLRYAPALLGAADPHTLAIFFWDASLGQWQDIESEPLVSEPAQTQSVSRFGVYALMAGPTWRDPFLDYLGLTDWLNVRLVYGGRLALRDGHAEGSAVSVLITPTAAFAAWGQVRYSAEIAAGASLAVDVLAADGTLLLANLPDDASLAGLDPAAHPSLRLRGRLSTQTAGVTPYLRTGQSVGGRLHRDLGSICRCS